jgi:TetR/AcrR family transcriptional regulator, cholesterol catabolism regulator
MPSLEYKKNRILEVSGKLFMTYGFKRVSMEEIARNAGVGKGTVYQLFSTKQELMLSTIDFIGAEVESAVVNILADETLPPIEKLQMLLRTVAETISTIRSETLKDLEIDFPEAFDKIQSTRQRIILGNLTELIRRGKQEGIYDPDINEGLAAHVVIGAINHVSQGNVISSFGCMPEQLFRNVLNIIMKGCLTPEYREMMQ